MAKAQLIQQEVLVSTYTLTLTEDEAKALAFITRRIGGDPYTTPRGAFDAINRALETVGIERYNLDYPSKGGVDFLNPNEAATNIYGGPFVEDEENPDLSDYEY